MRYTIQQADLWGNANDGYEVNDWYAKHSLDLDIDIANIACTDTKLIESIVNAGFFGPSVLTKIWTNECDYESYADSGIVYITLRLEADHYEELYKLEQVDTKQTILEAMQASGHLQIIKC